MSYEFLQDKETKLYAEKCNKYSFNISSHFYVTA